MILKHISNIKKWVVMPCLSLVFVLLFIGCETTAAKQERMIQQNKVREERRIWQEERKAYIEIITKNWPLLRKGMSREEVKKLMGPYGDYSSKTSTERHEGGTYSDLIIETDYFILLFKSVDDSDKLKEWNAK